MEHEWDEIEDREEFWEIGDVETFLSWEEWNSSLKMSEERALDFYIINSLGNIRHWKI
jgi:hypothetical protein